jgi:hypothetical protein
MASKGPFYRVERGRELGFPNLGRGGKNPGRGGSIADVVEGMARQCRGSSARGLASLADLGTVGSRASLSDDWEAVEVAFPPSTGRGPA